MLVKYQLLRQYFDQLFSIQLIPSSIRGNIHQNTVSRYYGLRDRLIPYQLHHHQIFELPHSILQHDASMKQRPVVLEVKLIHLIRNPTQKHKFQFKEQGNQ